MDFKDSKLMKHMLSEVFSTKLLAKLSNALIVKMEKILDIQMSLSLLICCQKMQSKLLKNNWNNAKFILNNKNKNSCQFKNKRCNKQTPLLILV